jgi:ATP-dependent Clp protease ATP-binding subunit ClpC
VSELIARIIERGEFPILATSTKIDYRRFIEGKALGSVLQKIDIEEADAETTLAAMQSKVAFFEHKYGVFYSLDSLKKIIDLSDRYIHDQVLPEKAIRLMEEAAVYVKKHKGEKQMILAEDIAKLMSEKTDIPLAQITEVESERLLNLEQIIHQRLVDQEEAVKAVASALRRARTQLRDEKRPIVNLLFLGPTGVGKTELAKTVAATYFGSEQEIVRLDMSEYQNKNSVSRLIGSESDPSGGYLTENIKHKPYTVLLLDELEKAHSDILNIFLQVMDDGRLTDWSGQTVDFTNTIIIATSNAGTRFIQEEISRGISLASIKEQLVRDKLKEYFRPEFLNRFDNIVVFRPLTPEHIKQIAALLLKKNSKRLEQKGIKLEVTDAALDELAREGFDPLFGARPMRRLIQDRVDDALAKYLLTGQVSRRDTVILDRGGKIRIKKARSL